MSPNPVSSTPILRRTLIWSAVATAVLAVVAGALGFAFAQGSGLVSGLLGVLLAALFLAITAISILVANRWYGDPIYVQLFFAIVLGGWLLKLGVFVVVMILLSGAAVDPPDDVLPLHRRRCDDVARDRCPRPDEDAAAERERHLAAHRSAGGSGARSGEPGPG